MTFREPTWNHSYRWLDESGIALYLADRLQQTARFTGLPTAVQSRFEQNLRDSRHRAQLLFEEFSRVVRAFSDTGARFVVHKGFALIPDYCPDPALRTQADMDFQIDTASVDLFAKVLVSLGYCHTRTLDGESTFDSNPDCTPRLVDLYKPMSNYRVELHFDGSDINHIKALPAEHAIEHKTLSTLSFPVLNNVETFRHQIAHVCQHLFDAGWIRLSMLYELRRFLLLNAEDREFWDSVRTDWKSHRSPTDIACALALMSHSFGLNDDRYSDLIACLPAHAKVWMEKYARKHLLALFPGTKLYLLLASPHFSSDHPMPAAHRPQFRNFVPLKETTKKMGAAMRAIAQGRLPSREFSIMKARLVHHLRSNAEYLIHKHAWHRALRRANLPT